MLREFKEFAMRGNVMDMAVGIILGTAFGKIITSLVNDVIMPPIGIILGKVDFSNLSIPLQQATEKTPAVTLNYGIFVNTVINFLIVAFIIFLFIRQINKLQKKKPEAAKTKACPKCFSDINIQALRCPACTSEI